MLFDTYLSSFAFLYQTCLGSPGSGPNPSTEKLMSLHCHPHPLLPHPHCALLKLLLPGHVGAYNHSQGRDGVPAMYGTELITVPAGSCEDPRFSVYCVSSDRTSSSPDIVSGPCHTLAPIPCACPHRHVCSSSAPQGVLI